jgi:hypothetical protein
MHNLRMAATIGSKYVFDVLLKDDRVDPSVEVANMLQCIMGEKNDNAIKRVREGEDRAAMILPAERQDMVSHLARHHSIKVEKLDVELVRLFIWALDGSILDRVKGFILAEARSGVLARERLSGLIERDGLYSMLIRVILIKRPSGLELMKWMISVRDKRLCMIASNIISKVLTDDSELVPMQALMLYIVYPTLTLQHLLYDLRAIGMGQDIIVKSARLVGLYIGETVLRSE